MSEVQAKISRQSADASLWVDEHGDYLFKYAVFRLRDSSAAEDAVQETFLAALKAYEKFEGRGSERTWLVGILKHKITDHFRRLTREAPLGQEQDEGPEHPEFFTRTDEWTNHWNADYAPSDWHSTPAELSGGVIFGESLTIVSRRCRSGRQALLLCAKSTVLRVKKSAKC
jgi:RNA polymerase sigma-70 factor (ECF subfamily)